MLAPIAANGLVCGYGEVKAYPYLFVENLTAAVDNPTEYFNYGVCANGCPDGINSTVSCYQNACSSFYDTNEALNYCIPTAAAINDAVVNGTDPNSSNYASDNYFVSMYESRWVVLTCIGISLLTALVYLKLMDWCAVQLAWVTIIFIEIALCALGYFSWAYMSSIEDLHLGESTS